MADPRPLPTAIHEMRGNPSKRPLNKSEPKPAPVFILPEPPEHLGDYGMKEWSRVGPILMQNNLLTEADLSIFEAYCMNVQILVISAQSIDEDGLTVRGERGGHVRNPALAAFGQASTAIRAFAAEFGMSPSSRSRIKLPSDDEDVLAGLMGDSGGPETFGEGV